MKQFFISWRYHFAQLNFIKTICLDCPVFNSSFVITILSNYSNKKLSIMNEYALIMRHEDGSRIASPEQMQTWMKQTMDWIGSIASQGKFVSGTGLPFDEAKVVHSDKTVTNGPFGDIKETIGGFIIVRADSAEEAAGFAKGCPVLQGDGNTVEVRKIAKNNGTH